MRCVLPHHPGVEALLHVHELLDLTLEEPVGRDPCPLRDDERDVVLVDLLLHHLLALRALGQAGLELREQPVADLGDAGEIAGPLSPLGLHAQLVDLARDLLHPVEPVLLDRPSRRQLVTGSLGLGELLLERRPGGSGLLHHRGELNLQLGDTALGLVELHRRRVDLHPQPRAGLVDEIDRLVREKPVGDVAVGEHRGRDERGVANPHPVMRLVALLEPAEDRDRVRDGRLADEDRLEPALERCVLLDVLAVLVERRRTDRAKLATREHRLEQVAGRDRALRGARADDGVQLVDEENGSPFARGDLSEHRLQAFLELAAILRAGDQRADVECPDSLAFEPGGDVTGNDALCEALGDRGLADAGLADQARGCSSCAVRAPGSSGGSPRRAR